MGSGSLLGSGMVNYALGDAVSRLRVGYCGRHLIVRVYRSVFVLVVLEALYRNGCILFYRISCLEGVDVYLKYFRGRPVMNGIKELSTPGVRLYSRLQVLGMCKHSFCGFFVVSTPKGVLTSTEIFLFKGRISGEVLLKVEL